MQMQQRRGRWTPEMETSRVWSTSLEHLNPAIPEAYPF
jgi:hypothetical protein